MIKILLWASLVLALIGGAGLVGTGYATAVMIIATTGIIIAAAIDIKKDGKPDQHAIIAAFVLPTMISRINGDAAEAVEGWLSGLWGWASDNLGEWVGTTSIGLALFAVVISFLMQTKAKGAR